MLILLEFLQFKWWFEKRNLYVTRRRLCPFVQENKICKLLKSLNGLKQAQKQWHEKLYQVLIGNGFSSIGVDRCVQTKLINDEWIIIYLYVTDMFHKRCTQLQVGP